MKCLLDVGDEIVGVLDADAHAKEAVRNAEPGPFVRREMRVRVVPRLADQGVYTAETRCVPNELEFADEPLGGASPPASSSASMPPKPLSCSAAIS